MDGTGGLALAQHVQATAGSRAAAVLLMAGPRDVVDADAHAAADVRAVIHKPLDSLQLLAAVREVLRSARPPRPAPHPRMSSRPGRRRRRRPRVRRARRLAPEAAAPGAPPPRLADHELEQVAARVAALWSGDARHEGPHRRARARDGAGARAGSGAPGRSRCIRTAGARRDCALALGARRGLSARRFGLRRRAGCVGGDDSVRLGTSKGRARPGQPPYMSTFIPPAVPESPALEGLEARFTDGGSARAPTASTARGRAPRSTPSTRRRRR